MRPIQLLLHIKQNVAIIPMSSYLRKVSTSVRTKLPRTDSGKGSSWSSITVDAFANSSWQFLKHRVTCPRSRLVNSLYRRPRSVSSRSFQKRTKCSWLYSARRWVKELRSNSPVLMMNGQSIEPVYTPQSTEYNVSNTVPLNHFCEYCALYEIKRLIDWVAYIHTVSHRNQLNTLLVIPGSNEC